jgi:hypothetical protein
LSHTDDLISHSDLNDTRRKALIFQRRQIQSEKNIEEIVRTNTEKVDQDMFHPVTFIESAFQIQAFYERCRDFYTVATEAKLPSVK